MICGVKSGFARKKWCRYPVVLISLVLLHTFFEYIEKRVYDEIRVNEIG